MDGRKIQRGMKGKERSERSGRGILLRGRRRKATRYSVRPTPLH